MPKAKQAKKSTKTRAKRKKATAKSVTKPKGPAKSSEKPKAPVPSPPVEEKPPEASDAAKAAMAAAIAEKAESDRKKALNEVTLTISINGLAALIHHLFHVTEDDKMVGRIFKYGQVSDTDVIILGDGNINLKGVVSREVDRRHRAGMAAGGR